MQNTNLARQREFFVPLDKLLRYEEFRIFMEHEKADVKIIDFIQFLYNKESPLSLIEDLAYKTTQAYELAELNPNASYAQQFLNVGESNVVVIDGNYIGDSEFYMHIEDMASCYLSRIQNCLKWELFCSYLSLFWQYNKRLRIPISMLISDDKGIKAMDTKTDIIDPPYELIRKMESLKKDIFGINTQLADVAEKKVRKVSPETWATKPNSR